MPIAEHGSAPPKAHPTAILHKLPTNVTKMLPDTQKSIKVP